MFTYKPYLEIYFNFRKFQTIYSGHIARFFNHLMLNVISLTSTRKKKKQHAQQNSENYTILRKTPFKKDHRKFNFLVFLIKQHYAYALVFYEAHILLLKLLLQFKKLMKIKLIKV